MNIRREDERFQGWARQVALPDVPMHDSEIMGELFRDQHEQSLEIGKLVIRIERLEAELEAAKQKMENHVSPAKGESAKRGQARQKKGR